MHLTGSATLVAVFFVQGLAFFAMSVSILVAARPRAALAMARYLWLLAVFGLLHSAASWLELLQQLFPLSGGLAEAMAPLTTALLLLYSLCLAQFGASVLVALVPGRVWVRSLPWALFLWAAVPSVVVGFGSGYSAAEPMASAEAVARYVLYLPAAFLSALAFHLQGKAPSFDRMPTLRRDCQLASAAFALYGLAGGAQVPTTILWLQAQGVHAPTAIVQLPIQIVRLLLAPVVAWVVVRTLRLFELEHLLEVEDLNWQLRRLSRAAVTAQEEERKRIALELHDDTAQILSSLLVRLKLLQASRSVEDLGSHCEELMGLAASATESIRRMAAQLRPTALDDLGLVAALQWYAERFARREKLQVDLRVSGPVGRLDPEIELAAYRIVQEALRNVAKHSHASRAMVLIELSGGKLRATIRDDGLGFDPPSLRRVANGGMGILGMSERAALVGGTIEICSHPGSGTAVQLEIPLQPAAHKGVERGQGDEQDPGAIVR